MKTLFAALTLCFLCAACHAAPTIDAADASKHVRETATVKGLVFGVHRSKAGNIFLNIGGNYPYQAFTAYIPSNAASAFPNADSLFRKTVVVTGKITIYKGKPEIIVTKPEQISIAGARH